MESHTLIAIPKKTAEDEGLRSIVREMTAWKGRSLNIAAIAFCLLVLVLGFRAVGAVT